MGNTEKRRFHRVGFDGVARLTCGTEELTCTVVDLSLHGALVAADTLPASGGECTLRIPLSEEAGITMLVRVVHTFPEEGRAGLECTSIDIDSIQQLRRLVELNLGDDEVLNRDLEALYRSARP